MDTPHQAVVTVVTCDTAVLVTTAGQPPLATTVDAWRQLVDDLRAGRWDRSR